MPDVLRAADFTRLRLRYGAQAQPDELPAVVERGFPDGRMADLYLVALAPALLADAALAGLGGIAGVAFSQQADAGWQVTFRPAGAAQAAAFALPEEEFRALLAANGLALPGEPGFTPPAAPTP